MNFSIPHISMPSMPTPESLGIPTTSDLVAKVMSKVPSIESFPKVQELAEQVKSKVPNADEYIAKGKEVEKLIKGETPDLKTLTGMDIPTEEDLMNQANVGMPDMSQYENMANDIPDFESESDVEEYFKSLSL